MAIRPTKEGLLLGKIIKFLDNNGILIIVGPILIFLGVWFFTKDQLIGTATFIGIFVGPVSFSWVVLPALEIIAYAIDGTEGVVLRVHYGVTRLIQSATVGEEIAQDVWAISIVLGAFIWGGIMLIFWDRIFNEDVALLWIIVFFGTYAIMAFMARIFARQIRKRIDEKHA